MISSSSMFFIARSHALQDLPRKFENYFLSISCSNIVGMLIALEMCEDLRCLGAHNILPGFEEHVIGKLFTIVFHFAFSKRVCIP